jgi:hypothetical protein
MYDVCGLIGGGSCHGAPLASHGTLGRQGQGHGKKGFGHSQHRAYIQMYRCVYILYIYVRKHSSFPGGHKSCAEITCLSTTALCSYLSASCLTTALSLSLLVASYHFRCSTRFCVPTAPSAWASVITASWGPLWASTICVRLWRSCGLMAEVRPPSLLFEDI